MEWGAPLFRCAGGSALAIHDRAQFGALRVALGCMRTIPTSVLLSEAGEPPLPLRRSLLSGRFILRNFFLRGSPLIPKLQLLHERVAAGRLRLLPSRCGLLTSYLSVLGVVEGRHRSRRASFFDVPWRELSFEVGLTVDRLFDHRPSVTAGAMSDSPGLPWNISSRLIFTDGSVDPAEGRAGCGFYVPVTNHRFGVRLPDDSSVLFSELYAIFSAVKHTLRMCFANSVILSDSRAALVCIRDRFTDPFVPYIVHSIARLLLLVSSRCLGVYLSSVPAHSGILVNETADFIAKSAARLPFTVRSALPFGDLLVDMRREFLAWCRLRWPYYGSRPTGSAYFVGLDYKSPRPWFRGCRAPRGCINLVTRLRTGHVCTGEHFARMG